MSKRYVSSADQLGGVRSATLGPEPKRSTAEDRACTPPASRDLGLEEDLQAIANRVPADQYGRVTAREFAIGKYSARIARPRYAKL